MVDAVALGDLELTLVVLNSLGPRTNNVRYLDGEIGAAAAAVSSASALAMMFYQNCISNISATRQANKIVLCGKRLTIFICEQSNTRVRTMDFSQIPACYKAGVTGQSVLKLYLYFGGV